MALSYGRPEKDGASLFASWQSRPACLEASISAIELGTRYPSLSTLECLAEVLHIRIVIGPQETTLEQE